MKVLVGRNVEQVERGTTLVDQAGKTIDEIVSSIRQINIIVDEISTASVQQRAGIPQVDDAVNQMERATQQSATLVKESAAAAKSMQGRAHEPVNAGRYAAMAPVRSEHEHSAAVGP